VLLIDRVSNSAFALKGLDCLPLLLRPHIIHSSNFLMKVVIAGPVGVP